MVTKYNSFILDVIKAWSDPSPQTSTNRRWLLMVSGNAIRLRSKMK